MKKLIFVALCAISSLTFAAETKKVCIDKMTKDGKTVIDKSVQTCSGMQGNESS